MLQLPPEVQTQFSWPATDSLRSLIVSRIEGTPGATVALSYIDLESTERLSINDDTVFHAASTMKIPVMMEVLRRSQAGAFSLDQPILLLNRFHSIVDGSEYSLDRAEDGDSALYAKLGERVPVRELMRRMITLSSNLATNQLIALVGATNVTAMARSLGASRMLVLRGVEDQKAFDRGLINTTTSGDLAALLLAIESGRALSPRSSAVMREILLAQEFNEKIPAGLPPGTRVAHKTGEITAVSHDAAIVYRENENPYVLVVLTRGVRQSAESSRLIADLSRIVYAHATRAGR
ncbi:MAG: serine hydrolase [Gemmatimonadaceae bacterium]|nr:serine hydrolase [Gemmatimonadaceae bacterium]